MEILAKIRDLSKKQKAAIGAGALTGIALFGGAVYAYTVQTKEAVPSGASSTATPKSARTAATPSIPPVAVKLPNRINGVLVDAGQDTMRPLAVMIENHPESRPQSGLAQADMVYEAIAEGGITRFMAVYANPSKPVRVGPVRSARTYYIDFATELSAMYAHVGGSVPALDQIKRTGVLDLDQFSVGSAAYARDFSRKVALEHTMYSSTDKLWNFGVNTRKWPATADVPSWKFQDEAAVAERGASQKVTVDVSDATYKVVWDYDQASNSYKRTMAGSAHKDAVTGEQIVAKSIILEQVDRRFITEAGNKVISELTLTGSGKATVIQNGKASVGTWKKTGTGRTRYYDAAGTEMAFVRGTVWTHLVHPESKITLQ